MIEINTILAGERLAKEHFACDLAQCKGACCTMRGAYGAPVLEEEIEVLEEAFSVLSSELSEAARTEVARRGLVATEDNELALACVDEGACVFVVWDGDVAKCAIQRAYYEGRFYWEKPLSCHLYPIRIDRYATHEVLRYEEIDECAPARKSQEHLAEYLERPLMRAYGASWYEKFMTMIKRERNKQ